MTTIAAASEDEIYSALGLQWIPPELREDTGEIQLARRGELPCLVEQGDIRGDLHTHTRLSDGSSSIQDMVKAAASRGYEYLAITDHSQALGVARGLTEAELRDEHAQIRQLQDDFPNLRLLCGVEVDIHVDCRLDCSNEFLAECDVVCPAVTDALPAGLWPERARTRL